MALILLIVIGALIGWLASIIARCEDSRGVLIQIGLGAAVAVVAGLLINNGAILGGLSATALLLAVAITSIAMAVYNLTVRSNANA